jgi:uncharacterized protein (TIGR00369 family)
MNREILDTLLASFRRQGLSATLGASLMRVEPGQVVVGMPFSERLTQQNGFVHGGAIATIADMACGYATLSLLPSGSEVLAAEFKINLMAPARASRFEARARILRLGRTLAVAQTDVFGLDDGRVELVATMLETVFVRRPEA